MPKIITLPKAKVNGVTLATFMAWSRASSSDCLISLPWTEATAPAKTRNGKEMSSTKTLRAKSRENEFLDLLHLLGGSLLHPGG